MNSLQILSFVGFTLLVAVITWWKVRKTDTGSQQGYFLAGRSLKAPVIAASLMLTNLSTEQLVGLSGQAYKSGMSVMGWEVTSAVTLIFLALIFLPRYLKRGIATIPDFLEERYDKTTRIIIDFCFLIATGVCFLPIVLYSGALALNSLFHVGESLQISHGAAIWLLVILLGLAGILYAVIGGLRAMAVADSINGIGLVIGGLMVPVFGLIAMGKGSFMQGIEQLTTVSRREIKLNRWPDRSLADWRGIYRFDSGEHLLLVYKSGHRATHAGVKKPGGRAKGGAVNGGAENARPAGTGAARVDCVSSVSGFTESRHGLPDAGQ